MRIFTADTETATMKGPIVDLAFIEIDENLEVVGTYESLIDPLVPIAPAAQAVHGISQAMVADAPTMAEMLARDGNFLGEGEPIIIFGHNVQFDCRMLDAEGVLPREYTKGCTLRMARNMWPDLDDERENHKLGTLAIMFGLESGPAHRAMGDAVTCLNLLRHIADTGKVSSFDELLALGTRTLSLDTKITFGKHKGMKLKNLPIGYVEWVCKQTDMDPDLRAALAVRL
jgi:exodeoxyribonuclease X